MPQLTPHYDPSQPLVVLRRFLGTHGFHEVNTLFDPSKEGPNATGDKVVELMRAGCIRQGSPQVPVVDPVVEERRKSEFEAAAAKATASKAQKNLQAARVAEATRMVRPG